MLGLLRHYPRALPSYGDGGKGTAGQRPNQGSSMASIPDFWGAVAPLSSQSVER